MFVSTTPEPTSTVLDAFFVHLLLTSSKLQLFKGQNQLLFTNLSFIVTFPIKKFSADGRKEPFVALYLYTSFMDIFSSIFSRRSEEGFLPLFYYTSY